MDQSTRLLGCLAKIAIAGAVAAAPNGGTVSRTFIPLNDAVTSGGAPIWLDVGVLESVSEQTSSSKIETYRPSPGVLVADDVLETKLKRELTATVSECSNAMWLLMQRALKATTIQTGAIGQYVPLSGGVSKMWLKLQRYDGQTNALLFAEQIWGNAEISDAVDVGGEKPIQFKLKFTQLWAPLNSATGN
jgi:hypothetical protein